MEVAHRNGDRRIGPFTVLGALPELAGHGLSGGAFGCLFRARADDGTEAVLKLCRPNGGSDPPRLLPARSGGRKEAGPNAPNAFR